MLCRLPDLLRTHRSQLKAEWLRLLKARPPVSPMGLPEILRHRMDDTLTELTTFLRNPPAARWLERSPDCMEQLRQLCRCGLNPLLDYYLTGCDALQAILGPTLIESEKRLLEYAWHLLAQHEIEALCGVCCRCPPVPELTEPAPRATV